jgi:hypothetical protein
MEVLINVHNVRPIIILILIFKYAYKFQIAKIGMVKIVLNVMIPRDFIGIVQRNNVTIYLDAKYL